MFPETGINMRIETLTLKQANRAKQAGGFLTKVIIAQIVMQMRKFQQQVTANRESRTAKVV